MAQGHGWAEVMRMERQQLAQRADGKVARMIGHALAGESKAELDRMAHEDQRRAQAGLVELRSGDRVWWKHIDELSIYDVRFRLESERALIAWLKARRRV